MKKNGFTLIELLAVILILGIIALIAVPTVNAVLNEARMGAFKSTAMNLASKAEETCQMEGIKGKEITSLYTIIDGKFDKPLEIKGDIPNEGYILINNNCEVAYNFTDSKNVVSKNFNENKPTVTNKDTTPVYGLKWTSNSTSLEDTYERTFDSKDIGEVDAQVGDTPVTNAFDELDIYKDILPYTDEFGNKFMIIPKFYISKTRESNDNEVTWNYAISKQKKDDTYYLPSNFVDEGVDNKQHVELPYVLVGKYEAASNGSTGTDERLVSKSGLMPRVYITINHARTLIDKYNSDDNSGYQQYDIHVHDLLTMLLSIEYKTMNSQSIMYGHVPSDYINIPTGGSDFVSSSSGTRANDGLNSFNYRGMENLWGNAWSFVEGVNVDQINEPKNNIYTTLNARYYSSDGITDYHEKINSYTKLNSEGYIKETGFEKDKPFLNLPTKVGGEPEKGHGDYYYQDQGEHFKIALVGGTWSSGSTLGMNYFSLNWRSANNHGYVGTRIIKTPLR